MPLSQARQNMVDCQIKPTDINNSRLILALREVPRDQFVPLAAQDVAYNDHEIKLSTRGLYCRSKFPRLIQSFQVKKYA